MRERNGRTLPFVFRKESDAIPTIRHHVPLGSIVHADEARAAGKHEYLLDVR